jgi:glycosyltransferase involved in cell wall biosynthesis
LEESGLRGRTVSLGGLLGLSEVGGEAAEAQVDAGTIDVAKAWDGVTRDVVLFVGRLIPEKRADLLPGVVRAVRKTRPDTQGLIIGDGPCRPTVERAITQAEMDGVVRTAGFVETARVGGSMAAAGCLLLPSLREGYGIVVVEAAAHGTPVVVVSGEDNAAADLISDGVNGYVAHDDGAEAIAAAVLKVLDGGSELRRRTRQWFDEHEVALSATTAGRTVIEYYRGCVTGDVIEPTQH